MLKNKRIMADIMLLTTAIIWGSAFVVMKNTLDAVSPNYILAFRFSAAALILGALLFKRVRAFKLKDVLCGALMGIFMYLGYYVQSVGLIYTTAGKNAFITAVYVIIVPFLYWITRKRRPSGYNVAAAIVCLVGIGLLSLGGDLSVNIGDALTLLCGIFYAIHIVLTSMFTETRDALALTVVQFAVSGLIAFVMAFATESFPTNLNAGSIGSLAYLCIVATLLALTMQNIGLKYAEPSHASLLMGTESFFGAMFGVLLLGESFTVRTGFGAVLIMAAVVISETQLKFLRKHKRVLEVKAVSGK
jgi:drug/metabolite transporter (DMT)-like permease